MNFMIPSIMNAEVEQPSTGKVTDKERIQAAKKAQAEGKRKEQEAKKQAQALEKQKKKEQKALENASKGPKKTKPKKVDPVKDSEDTSDAESASNIFGMKKKKPRAQFKKEIEQLQLQLAEKEQTLAQKEQILSQQTRELNQLKNWARSCPVH